MDIIISNSSDKPIYEQISYQLKGAILSGELASGEQLPSIRALATRLCVSVITTKRAYTELESEGFIETVQGKGSFVTSGSTELLREEHMRAIESLFTLAITEGRTMDLSDAELREMFETLLSIS